MTPRRQGRAARILDAAAALILRWGYNKTTIDDVAREAGVAKGTIYLHWNTREELFAALMQRERAALSSDVRRRIGADPASATLRGTLKHSALALMQRPLLKAVLLGDMEIIGKLARSEHSRAVYTERLYGRPMDVEWMLHDGHMAVVQARPITTLHDPEPSFEVWNDSRSGDYLWTKGNVGEAVPSVMTPCDWSLIKIFMTNTMPVPDMGGHSLIGNIGGRFYMNVSVLATLAAAFGFSPSHFAEANEQAFGRIPPSLGMPLVPSRAGVCCGPCYPWRCAFAAASRAT